MAFASCSGRRVLITQYGVGSSGSSTTTRTAPRTQGRCTTNAIGSASAPMTSRFASASKMLISVRNPTAILASSTCSIPSRTAIRIRLSPSRAAITPPTNTTYGIQAKLVGAPKKISAAASAASASEIGHHHHGTMSRSEYAAAGMPLVDCCATLGEYCFAFKGDSP